MKSCAFKVLGDQRVKAEFTREHCRRLARWFDSKGNFVHYGTQPSSRERLWNCFSLLTHGGRPYAALAEQIILKTPVDRNGFQPFAAVELLLRFRQRLSPPAQAHLLHIVREHLMNTAECRLGSSETHNFTCMGTWFLLAASQVVDTYAWKHPLANIPEVYTRRRVFDMGLNALYSLAYLSEHQPVFSEWNSPTYSPISLHCLAKIVELIPDDEAKAIALQIEMKLWRELLAFYHPQLGLACGPWSRAYRCDMLGQNSQMRILMTYVGLSKDRSIVKLFDETQKDLIFHHDGDIPFTWSGPAWQLAARFHVPIDALAELKRRRFPHRFEAPVQWSPFGHIDPKTKTYVPVQGTALPGGDAVVAQIQWRRASLGYRTHTGLAHSFPINLHYALTPVVKTMRDVRSVTAAVFFRNAPEEWVPDQTGKPMEAQNFNTEGDITVAAAGKRLTFAARPFPELESMPSSELSFNSFVPLHFVPGVRAWFNGQAYLGQPMSFRSRRAHCRVEDAGTIFEIEYAFAQSVEIRLYTWANFLRFAGFWYSGQPRLFAAAALKKLSVKGRFSVMRIG